MQNTIWIMKGIVFTDGNIFDRFIALGNVLLTSKNCQKYFYQCWISKSSEELLQNSSTELVFFNFFGRNCADKSRIL